MTLAMAQRWRSPSPPANMVRTCSESKLTMKNTTDIHCCATIERLFESVKVLMVLKVLKALKVLMVIEVKAIGDKDYSCAGGDARDALDDDVAFGFHDVDGHEGAGGHDDEFGDDGRDGGRAVDGEQLSDATIACMAQNYYSNALNRERRMIGICSASC